MTETPDTCSEKCWTEVKCPEHGDWLNPFGRDAGYSAHYCCDNYLDPSLNPRHLWSEHDSTRWYTDPKGWEAHEKNCKECGWSDD